MFLTIALLITGLILLVYGSDRLVYGAAVFARSLKIPPYIVGLTIMGIGTSLPELMVSITAAQDGLPNMAIGNAIGSNITNLLLITGAASLIRPITVKSDILRRELPLMLLITAFVGYILAGSYLSRLDGIVLLLTALFFIALMIKMTTVSQDDGLDSYTQEREAELPVEGNKGIALLWVVLGLIILPISTRMVIDNAAVVARIYGISELIIGLTILAVGTSLPELATSIAAAIKGENDMAMGNIIGSNVFNITLVLGIPGILSPSVISPQAFSRDFWVMMAASVLFTIFCLGRKHRLNRLNGVLLLGCFIAYFVVLFVSNYYGTD
ncbi:calcium/sodium antiporter [Xenorhabdus bovienii]|uniref:Putative Na:Ca transport protein (CacA family) n=1 Tax=Xenorhabdus bovienii str. kraussei Quebec TaxID=1398203 RepID=A0A077PIE7_XENBV|nr:calcium/sodium antiporter [Xenorhabdus bovienii]MDE9533985.1 calcium/sodium antiporter [Xenorhabdus bovienii]MDE9540779.1 calcium/sodium antiporter [Xenorhabdus bovienii]MDE9587903.1 calcium/sodium antiporter [Xenorhabdus bovienii]CDH20422.1 putative Na:Ca transport protein (CacA family) [Xenorhabdus bovienii str. kraussei Quebec]